MKLTSAEQNDLHVALRALDTALQMLRNFEQNPADNLGTLLNIREQCWQAARETTALAAALMERRRLTYINPKPKSLSAWNAP